MDELSIYRLLRNTLTYILPQLFPSRLLYVCACSLCCCFACMCWRFFLWSYICLLDVTMPRADSLMYNTRFNWTLPDIRPIIRFSFFFWLPKVFPISPISRQSPLPPWQPVRFNEIDEIEFADSSLLIRALNALFAIASFPGNGSGSFVFHRRNEILRNRAERISPETTPQLPAFSEVFPEILETQLGPPVTSR